MGPVGDFLDIKNHLFQEVNRIDWNTQPKPPEVSFEHHQGGRVGVVQGLVER